jgi:tripartite-type tricarboxylate transporter receptor subunit TctC
MNGEDKMRFRAAVCVAALALGMAHAMAQDYPSKPIRILVGFAPGGIVVEGARYLADFITRETGQQAIVENRTGAAGVPALGVVAKADPDGYTIAVTISGSLVISPFVQKQMPLDVTKDLALVSSLVESPQFIAINAQLPAKNLAEFIALAKQKPGGFDYGSAGVGSLPHLSAALFAHQSGLNMVHVPFRGAQPAVAELMAGRIAMIASSVGDLQAGIDGGTIRVLVAAANKRLPYLPDVPSAPEAGMPNFLVSTWLGVVAPAATPQPIIDRLHQLSQAMLKDPAMQKRLATRNIEPMPMSQAEFRSFVAKQYDLWKGHIQTIGVEAQ